MIERTRWGIPLLTLVAILVPSPAQSAVEEADAWATRGFWVEAAGDHLDAAHATRKAPLRSAQAAAAIRALATVGRACTETATEAARLLDDLRAHYWIGDGADIPAMDRLWRDLYLAACRNDQVARFRLRTGDYGQAPDVASQVWIAQGDLMQMEGRLEGAAESYELFLSHGTTGILADAVRIRLAQARLELGEIESARKLLGELKEDESLPGPRRDALRLYGRIARREGKLEEALTHLEQAAGLFTEDAVPRWEAELELAEVAVKADRREQAVAVLSRIADKEGHTPPLTAIRMRLAELLREQGDDGQEQARSLYRTVMQSPDMGEAVTAAERLVEAWIESGRPLRAFAEMLVLIESEDLSTTALGRERFAQLLPEYVRIFHEREDHASMVVLYRLAERAWQLPVLDPEHFQRVGEAFAELGLPAHRDALTELARQTAVGRPPEDSSGDEKP